MKSLVLAYTEVRQRKTRINPEQSATIHRLRVAFKKFRYLLEFLQPASTGIHKRQLKEMQSFQVMMGDIQDLSILLAHLDANAHRKGKPDKRVLQPLVAELRRRLAAHIAAFASNADTIDVYQP